MKMPKIILPLAVAAFALYDQIQTLSKQNKTKVNQDQFNAIINQLQAENAKLQQNQAESDPATYSADKLQYSVEALFSGIADVYWGSAYYVTIKNPTKETIRLNGIRMTFAVNGQFSQWIPVLESAIIIPPNNPVRVRLSGTTAYKLWATKGERKSVRETLQSAGNRVEIKDVLRADITVAWNTGTGSEGDPITIENVPGTIMWTKGVSYADGKNGAKSTLFNGGVVND